MRRAIGITMLTVLAACASETQTGSPTIGEFPMEGPHSTVREDTDDFIYFFPASLDDEETWPALVWFNGLSGYTEDNNYNGLLESIASWGFLVVGGKHSGMNPAEVDQREELLRRNADADDDWFGKVDEARIAIAGHSLGGFQTTAVSDQYRIATAIQGAGVPTMEETSPTLFMTSEGDEVVESSIVITAFERAINDAWLANHATADHEDPRTDGGVYREPMIAFLRWQLHGDRAGEGWYVGEGCGLCTDPSWSFDDR
jgi:dienelactone hydrolase